LTEPKKVIMNRSTQTFALLALWAVFAVGCNDVESDRPATRPEASEPTAPRPDSADPSTGTDTKSDTEPGTQPETQPGSPAPDARETATDEQTDPSEDAVEDLGAALQEIAALEKDAEFFDAFKRVRDLLKTYRDRPEASELLALQQRLYRYHRRSSGLDFAISQLGADSEVTVSVATEKLLEAGEVGLILLRKALRQAEPKIAAAAAEILFEQGEPQITRLMVERMEQDPLEPLGDKLGRLLQRPDTIESEWIDRLCALANRKGPSRAGAVNVMIDLLDKSIRAQLKAAVAENVNPEAAEKDEPKPPEPAPVQVDESLVRTLYEVAETAEGPVQRRSVEALVLVLGEVNRRDGEAFNQLLGSEDAYGFVGDYVVACLSSNEVADRVWAIARAAVFGMKAQGLWARVRLQPSDKPRQAVVGPVIDERLDPVLDFADLAALGRTGPVEQGQSIRWKGFVNVPSEGQYTFSVDCDEHSPTTLYVDGEQVTADGAVELSGGWHDLQAEMSVAGDQARLVLSWVGPDLKKQSIPAERLACADRTRMLIWRLGRECDLPQARSFAEQLLHGMERVDQDLPAKLTSLAEADRPARPAIAGVLAEVLDYSIASGQEPLEWESPALKVLLAASREIEGPEQLRVVATLVSYLVRRADGEIEEFNRQAESPQAYRYLWEFISERLDADELSIRLWAAGHAEPFALLGSGLEGSYFDKNFEVRFFDRVDAKLQFEPGRFGYPDERNEDIGIRWTGLINVPADGEYVFSNETHDTCRLWLDGQPVMGDSKKPAKVNLTAGLHEIRLEYVGKPESGGLAVYWQPPGDSEKQVLAGELKHVDSVQLLVDKLTERPDDPQTTAWLEELSYKADRLTAETTEELIEMAAERAAWQGPLASVAAAVVLRDPGKAPDSAVPLLGKSAPTMKEHVRRRAVQALAVYFSAACGNDKQKFQQASGSDKTYEFLCGEVQSVADSANATDTQWAHEQARRLGLKISTTVHQEKDGGVLLHAEVADLHGTTIKYETGGGKDNLGFWTNAADFASWRLAVEKGGEFDVSLTWACEDGYEGSEFVLAVADQQLTGKVAATGDWANFQTMNLGTIKLGVGTHHLTVKAKAVPKRAVMNLQSITLEFRE
jgi:hypothetical protein